MDEKEPFDIDRALEGVRQAVEPYPPAGLFALADEGYGTLFEALVGCIISIRTRDEDLMPVARRLFARARTPDEIAALSVEELEGLLAGCQYPGQKARQIQGIAQATIAQGGTLPADESFLLSLTGVGPKCANLALGVAHGEAPHAAVDIHVHRITNRWGYVATTTPEKTMAALDTKLPEQYRVEINRLLVPFGKHICTGQAPPRCSTCPVLSMCQQVGVTKYR